MARKDYILMLGLIIVSGLIGGSLTSLLVSGHVIAENVQKPAKVLQTERLQIVDSKGQVRIELSIKPLIQMTDSKGRVIWSAPTYKSGMLLQ